MKRSLAILLCAGFFLTTSLSYSQSQFKPKGPGEPPDGAPDRRVGGTDHVPSPAQLAEPYRNYTLSVLAAGIENDRVWFRFGARVPTPQSGIQHNVVSLWVRSSDFSTNVKYHIYWFRQGRAKAKVADMILPGTKEYYFIPEIAKLDTVYTLQVQAEVYYPALNFNDTGHQLGFRDRPSSTGFTNAVGRTFQTPPPYHPGGLADKIKKKPSPFSGIVDIAVPLIPNPIIDRQVVTKGVKGSAPR